MTIGYPIVITVIATMGVLRQNKNGGRHAGFTCCWSDVGRVIEDDIQVAVDKGAYL